MVLHNYYLYFNRWGNVKEKEMFIDILPYLGVITEASIMQKNFKVTTTSLKSLDLNFILNHVGQGFAEYPWCHTLLFCSQKKLYYDFFYKADNSFFVLSLNEIFCCFKFFHKKSYSTYLLQSLLNLLQNKCLRVI